MLLWSEEAKVKIELELHADFENTSCQTYKGKYHIILKPVFIYVRILKKIAILLNIVAKQI